MGRPKKEDNNNIENAALITALSSTEEPQKNSALDNLAVLLSKRMEREEEELAEQVRVSQKARQAGAKAMQDRRDGELAFQSQCPHMKQWGGSAIGGQRDHQGNYQWICPFCGKRWINDELPPHLRIAMDRVGGPNA